MAFRHMPVVFAASIPVQYNTVNDTLMHVPPCFELYPDLVQNYRGVSCRCSVSTLPSVDGLMYPQLHGLPPLRSCKCSTTSCTRFPRWQATSFKTRRPSFQRISSLKQTPGEDYSRGPMLIMDCSTTCPVLSRSVNLTNHLELLANATDARSVINTTYTR